MSTVSDISMHIQENEEYIRSRCENCDDIIIRPMLLGDEKKGALSGSIYRSCCKQYDAGRVCDR